MLESFVNWLLVLLGVALGWVLARKAPTLLDAAPPPATSEQLGGLITQLAGDDPDRALAALTQAAEMDHSMAELHLTLGSLFRKRGEVDRALRVHEALLARTNLKPELRDQARFELALDYVKAGVIDRAEQLFGELTVRGPHVAASLEQLQSLYEQGRDWKQAIEAARRLESVRGESRRAVIAQYLCEQAEEARVAKDLAGALKLAKRALDEHSGCVRANLMLGALHEADEDIPAAIKAYRRALDQDPRYLAEVIEPLRRCYQQTGDLEGYSLFLRDAKEMTQSSLPWLSEAQLLRDQGQDAMSHLAEGLEQRPSRAVLAEFLQALEQRPEIAAVGLEKTTASLRKAIKRLMDATPGYQCTHCGFQPRQLFWQCPSCRQWATTAPSSDVLKPGQ